MKKILIVSANYYKDISKNLIINAKKKLQNSKFNSNNFTVTSGDVEVTTVDGGTFYCQL